MRAYYPEAFYCVGMIIWLLALVLFGCLAYAGYAMGAIRAAASLIGLIIAALLAPHLGHVFTPLLKAVTVKNPMMLWALGPFIAFLVVLAIFKIIGHAVHRKVDVYYKYKAGDLRMGLFNRLNARLGIAVGMANAAVYLVLISWVIYVFSYVTSQIATDNVGWMVKTLNLAGDGLDSSGMSKVAGAVDGVSNDYYQTADIAGLIYHNDLLEGRLTRYPAFLALGERPVFQTLGNDTQFSELRQRQPPISEIIDNPEAQAVLKDPELLDQIWAILKANLPDLTAYLKTGQSAKYDGEKILGRWDFDLRSALNAYKRNNPKVTVVEMGRVKEALTMCFAKTTFVATPEPDKLAFLKNYGKLIPPTKPKTPPTVETKSFNGTWSSDGSKYDLNFPDKGGSLDATVEGDALIVSGDLFPMVFLRE
ncbi:MAG TPA: CvpA family protein [Verrucomicrobiae bacterium]|nr:CvpA family protein [Verrucomicrobiae bacterium]